MALLCKAIRRNIVLLTKSPAVSRNVKRFYSPRLTPVEERFYSPEETSVEKTMRRIVFYLGYTEEEYDAEVSQEGGPTMKNHVDRLFRKEPPELENELSGRMLFRNLPCQQFIREDDFDFDDNESDDDGDDIDDVRKGGGQ